MIRFLQIALLSAGICLLAGEDANAQRGKGGGKGSSMKGGGGASRGGGSISGRSGLGASIRGRSSSSGLHGSHSHGSSLHSHGIHSHGGIGSSRRIPNSAARIRSLQSPLLYGSSLYGSSRYGASYSRSRYGGSSLGIYIGGVSPYSRYGNSLYGPSTYGYGGYNYISPSVGYYDQYPILPAGSDVPIIYNDLTGTPLGTGVLPAPIPARIASESGAAAGSPPRNSLPARSVVSLGAPDIGQPGKAVLFNPAESGGSVQYLLNGMPYTIRPGEAQPIDLDRNWTLEFDRGLNNETARYSLNEGIHKFKVGRKGWEVVQATPNKTAETRKQPTLPAPPVPVESNSGEAPPPAAGDTQPDTPVPAPDDSQPPAIKAPTDSTTTDDPPVIEDVP